MGICALKPGGRLSRGALEGKVPAELGMAVGSVAAGVQPLQPGTFLFKAQGRTVQVQKLPPIENEARNAHRQRATPRLGTKAAGKWRTSHRPKGEIGSMELQHLGGIKMARRPSRSNVESVERAPTAKHRHIPSCPPPSRDGRVASGFCHGEQPSKQTLPAAAPVLRPVPPRTPIGLQLDETPTINTTKTLRPSMLALVAAQLGWREDRSNKAFAKQLPRAHVVWVVSKEELNNVLSSPLRRENTRISRIPGMHELCRKACFARLLRDSGATTAPEGEAPQPTSQSILRTWILPGERPPAAAFDRGPLIVKPDDGSQGAGISLITSPVELELIVQKMARKGQDAAVVQEYVDRPLLVNGYKFDLRLYVLILSLSPLRVFLCNEGLVRVCSESYFEPTGSATREERLQKNKLTRHLTNYGVNKHNDAHFDDSDDPADGSRGTKRTLSSTLAYLRARGDVPQGVWNSICELVRKTTLQLGRACRDERPEPELQLARLWCEPPKCSGTWPRRRSAWNPHHLRDREKRECFQLVGLDVIVDDQGTPHILEANCNPSFNFDKVDVVGADTISRNAKAACPPLHGGVHERIADETGGFAGFSPELLSSRLRGFGTKVCRCSATVKPHIHRPSKVDLVVKGSAIGGLYEILSRDIRARAEVNAGGKDEKGGEVCMRTERLDCSDGCGTGVGLMTRAQSNTNLWSTVAQCQTGAAVAGRDNCDDVSTPRGKGKQEHTATAVELPLSHAVAHASQLAEGTSYSVIWAGDEDELKEPSSVSDTPTSLQLPPQHPLPPPQQTQ